MLVAAAARRPEIAAALETWRPFHTVVVPFAVPINPINKNLPLWHGSQATLDVLRSQDATVKDTNANVLAEVERAALRPFANSRREYVAMEAP
jgi:hypothetical protein